MDFGVRKIMFSWQKIFTRSKYSIFLLFSLFLVLFFASRFSKTISTIVNQDLITQESADWQKYQPDSAQTPFFKLTPTTSSEYGVLPQETFILTATAAVDPEFINQNLIASVNYRLKQVDEKSYQIETTNVSKTDDLITFNFQLNGKQIADNYFNRDYNWAFQVRPKFSVTSILPGDKKTNVPLNSGIEIVFNQDGYQDPASFISITPNIPWRSEKHTRTFSIVPLSPLEPKTIYTVTLRKGLSLQSRSDPITQDKVFSFQTEENSPAKNRQHLSLTKNFIQVATLEPAAVNTYSNNWPDGSMVRAKIFKFANISQFIQSRKIVDSTSNYWYRHFDNDLTVDTKNLLAVSEVDLKLEKQNDVTFLKLPEALPAGYYLVQFWYDDFKHVEQLWLQSTDISAYISVGRRQTLVWANDVKSGQPINGAVISTDNSSVTSQTSANGISVFDTPLSFFDKSTLYLKVSNGDSQIVLPVTSLSRDINSTNRSPDDYWSYIYHERSLYKSGDTLNFWGVIKDRASSQVPSNIKARITNGYQSIDSPKDIPLASVNITPKSDGSFIGSIVLNNIPKGYHQIAIVADDLTVTSSGFNITEYQKPELKIEVTSDKTAIFTDEKVEFTAQVSFYDGTPAKNIPLDIYQQYNSTPTSVKTDNHGQIKYTYVPTYESNNNSYSFTYPRYESITIKSALVSNDNLAGYGSVLVFGEKLSLTPTSNQDGQRASISAKVNNVILDNLNQKKSNITLGAPAPNQEVEVNITKNWWEKIEQGTYYDFIEKVTRKSYRYDQHSEKFPVVRLKTDQNGQVNYQFDMEEDKSYHVTLSLKDKDQHPVTSNLYFYYYYGSQSNSDDRYAKPQFVLDQKENKFSLGDKVSFSIKYKNQDYPDNDQNRFLYILSQNGRQDFFTEDSPKFNFDFSSKHIPNVNASAIIFTGKYYQVATPSYDNNEYYYWESYDDTFFNSMSLVYDSDDSRLDITASSDKDKYLPGDTAKITVKVNKDSQPVSNASVNLVLVDQAMEAIGGVYKPSILGSIYSSISNQIYYNYYSHQPISYLPPAAEKGGGGGDNREIFKDTPYFGQSTTNEAGLAVFEVSLPDNITTWLVYSQAITSSLLAGHSESSLVVTKDFFVTSNYPINYLTRDTAFVSGNGFGANIAPNQSIAYQLKVSKDNQEITSLTGQGKSSADTQFQLPKLSEGDYKVRLRGSLGDQVDGLTQSFKVIDSRVNVKASQTIELAKGQSVDSLNLPGLNPSQPVKLVISDIGYGKYFHKLHNFCYSYSNRLEKYIAASRASQIIKDRFDDNSCLTKSTDFTAYQNTDGGLSQVVWGGSVLETTVWSIFVNPSPFNQPQLITYFTNQLNNPNLTTTQKIYALWGLSLLGQPQLAKLNSLSLTAVSFSDQVIIGLALASLGDMERASDIYQKIVATYVYANKPYFRIQSGQDTNTIDTSLALLLGSYVDKSLNRGFYLYLDHNFGQTEDLILDLSRIAYLDSEMASLPQESSQITLTVSGSKETVSLSKGRSKVITIPGDKVKNTNIVVDSGKAEINSYYFLSSSSFSQIKRDDRLSISRHFKPIDNQENKMQPGTIIAIKIDHNLTNSAPEDCYTITDHLPSGLTFIADPSMYGLKDADWVIQKDKNVVQYRFCNDYWWRSHNDKQVIYYARASAIGTYVAEPVVFQSNLDLSIIQTTPEDKITIEGLN